MQQPCPNCGFVNRVGVLICENCGVNLVGNNGTSTRNLPPRTGTLGAGPVATAVESALAGAGSGAFPAGSALRIEVDGGADPVLVTPMTEVVFGRRDPGSGTAPDVDLTAFSGYRMGVSRRHAVIRFNESKQLDLLDLGSSNGTFLNGSRLIAYKPYRVRDGDEIKLGQLIMRAYFQPPRDKEKTS